MTRVYRILRKPCAKKPLDGEGAFRFGGRWSNSGTRLAYTSQHLSLAMIEYYVHIDPSDSPSDLVVASADIPDGVSRTRVVLSRLPSNWRQSPAPLTLAAVGDSFATGRKSAILIVPSVLAPSESNWLINPNHPELRLLDGQPVPDPHSFGRGTLDACDAGGQFRREQPVIGRLDGQLPDGGDSDVDRNRPEPACSPVLPARRSRWPW